MIGRIIFGLFITVVGALISIYSEAIFSFFGAVPFAEKFLRSEGGSRLFYQLLGILIAIIGFLIMTGLIESLLTGIAKLFVPGI